MATSTTENVGDTDGHSFKAQGGGIDKLTLLTVCGRVRGRK